MSVLTIGSIFGAAIDISQGVSNISRGDSPVASNDSIGGNLFGVGSGAAGILGELRNTASMVTGGIGSGMFGLVNFAGAYDEYKSAVDSGDTDAIISKYLGLAAVLGDLVSAIPTPHTKGLGLALKLGATAAKLARDAGLRPKDLGFPGDGAVDQPFIEIPWSEEISESSNISYRDAKNWRQPVDPLMLDLDGDGLELRRADGSVLFDHDADLIKTGTGWIGADDGILVRDLNGDGQISSGLELFGVDTLKLNGQKATDGFDALVDLDTNQDGKFTSADGAWSQVKVWRDLDQDGVSDAAELFGLEQLGISRIGVVGSATNTTGGTQAGTTVSGNAVALSAKLMRDGMLGLNTCGPVTWA